MTWQYHYTTNLWITICTAVLIALLGLYSWRHRSVPGAGPFAVACFLSLFWLAGIVAETVAVSNPAKIAWYRFQMIWGLPCVTAITFFALEYVWPGRWLTRRYVLMASIPLLLNLGLNLTSALHPLMSLEFTYDGALLLSGVGLRFVLGYGMGLALVNIAAFFWLFVHSPQHRWPVALMTCGQIISRGLFLLDLGNLDVAAPFDSLILAFLAPFVIYAIALFGFRIFDPQPAAHKLAIAQMQEGVVVLDSRWHVVNLNPAAEKMLSVPKGRARGQPLQKLAPGFRELALHLDEVQAGSLELSLREGHEARDCTAHVSSLRDRRGLVIGYLLLLRDVTERHRAQARLLAEQWAQATLQERELLAQELHDGLSQNLAFLNLQAQAAQIYLQTEQEAAAQDSLARLVNATREIQADMRELIGNLLAVSLPSEGFCTALRQFLVRFEEHTRLHVDLEIGQDTEAICDTSSLPPSAGVQLLRIVQEALANVRKHAGSPNRVAIRLTAEAGHVCLAIEDDGTGFDITAPAHKGNHFGLQVMRQRVASIGGQLTIHSAPNLGTRIEACVPLTEIPADHHGRSTT